MADQQVELAAEVAATFTYYVRQQAVGLCAGMPAEQHPPLLLEHLRDPLPLPARGSSYELLGQGSQGMVLRTKLGDGTVVARKVRQKCGALL